MNSAERQCEREEAAIMEAQARGEISSAEAMKQINEVWRDYRESARESAMEAYERELERW